MTYACVVDAIQELAEGGMLVVIPSVDAASVS